MNRFVSVRTSQALSLMLVLIGVWLTACSRGPTGHASPEAAVLSTMPQLKQSGATLHTVATLPPGTLVIYTYMQQGKCGTAYGMASQQQGLWHASSAGMSVGSCPIPGVGPAIWSMGHFGGSRQPGSGWTAALGQIRDTTVASVEVHWDDGAVTVATISQDMFYTYHPASAEIVSVVAYDTGGNVLETVPRP